MTGRSKQTTQERIASFPKRIVVDLRGLHCETPFGIVDPGEPGYQPIYGRAKSLDQLDAICAQVNHTRAPTVAERQAAQFGSLFGWHVPAADPANYDEAGEYIRSTAVGETARDNPMEA